MAIARERPYVKGNFLVDLGTGDTESARAGFTHVILPEAEIDTIEYRNGNERSNEPRKLIGQVGYTNLVLRRGLIGELDLYEWWNQARNGDQNARRTITVSLLSEDRADVVWRWRFTNAFPSKYSSSDLCAEANDVVMETIEISVERMEID
jgi:phage tail-like protein